MSDDESSTPMEISLPSAREPKIVAFDWDERSPRRRGTIEERVESIRSGSATVQNGTRRCVLMVIMLRISLCRCLALV